MPLNGGCSGEGDAYGRAAATDRSEEQEYRVCPILDDLAPATGLSSARLGAPNREKRYRLPSVQIVCSGWASPWPLVRVSRHDSMKNWTSACSSKPAGASAPLRSSK
jgi:hypothetical protein